MRSVQTKGTTGPDGVLSLAIQLGTPETEWDVVVIVQPRTAPPVPEKPLVNGVHPDWPAGFFDEIAGKWEGEVGRSETGDLGWPPGYSKAPSVLSRTRRSCGHLRV